MMSLKDLNQYLIDSKTDEIYNIQSGNLFLENRIKDVQQVGSQTRHNRILIAGMRDTIYSNQSKILKLQREITELKIEMESF